VDDCCFNIPCTTYEYWFDQVVIFDTKEYLQLNTDHPGTGLSVFGKYYREEDGSVYMKINENQAEVQIYNFNLSVGEQFEIQNLLLIEVTAIDSITLNSGEKRKRLEVIRAGQPSNKTFWIEGIGDVGETWHPGYTFWIDCWTELTCYHKANNLEYELGECQPTSLKNINQLEKTISCYPNPAIDQISITLEEKEKIEKIEIIGSNGNSILQISSQFLQPIKLNGIQEGLYFLKVIFKDGSIGLTKFVKNKN